MVQRILEYLVWLVSKESPYRGAILAALTLLVLWVVYKISRQALQPFVRSELADSHIRLRLRYNTIATKRQRISSEITNELIRRFNRTPNVEFAYPHVELLHRPKANRTAQTPPPDGSPGE